MISPIELKGLRQRIPQTLLPSHCNLHIRYDRQDAMMPLPNVLEHMGNTLSQRTVVLISVSDLKSYTLSMTSRTFEYRSKLIPKLVLERR